MMSGGFRVSASTIETAAKRLESMHWNGEGCGTHGNSGCLQCFGPSPMDAYEVTREVLAAVVPSLVAEIRAQTVEADDDEPRIIQPCGIVFPHRPHQWPKFKPMPHLRDCRGVARGDAG